jgi:hypothetical protein
VKNVARAKFLSLRGLDPGKFKPRPLLTAWQTQVGPAATSGLCQKQTHAVQHCAKKKPRHMAGASLSEQSHHAEASGEE